MKDYSIAEQFALIALTGQDSLHMTEAKKAAIIGIAAIKKLQELFLDNVQTDIDQFKIQLETELKLIEKMRVKEQKETENQMVTILRSDGVIKEIPNLLGCDLNYYTAEITMREYKTEESVYQNLTERLRAEILEPGEITLETLCLLWLFRECGCMHDIFSSEEQQIVQRKMIEAASENAVYQTILNMEFHSGVRKAYLKFLDWKHDLFKNPYLEGINIIFPFFDRKQAVFIDMVIMGTTVQDRRQAAIQFLQKNGHTCEELVIGGETLVKIDNAYYRIWPTARQYQLPVQGVELIPVYR